MESKETLSPNGSPEQPDPTPQQSLEEPSTSSSSPEMPRTEAEMAAEVAALFQEPAEPPATPETGEPEAEVTQSDPVVEEPASLDLKTVAETLDMEPEALYDLEITTGDGEAVTLGVMKDAYQNRQQAERETAERDATLNSREAQVIADQQVWSVLAATGQLPQRALETAKAQLGQHQKQQTDILMTLVPELQDNAKLDNFRRDTIRVMGEVGMKPHEIALTDHRQALFIRKYVQMERELKALKAAAKPTPPKAGKPNGRGKPPPKSAHLRNARHGSEAQKVSAVGQLLNGG